MSERLNVLGIYGGDGIDPMKDRVLRAHLNKVLHTAELMGAEAEFCSLHEHLTSLHNAQPSKEIYPGARQLGHKVSMADILVLATPVHWRLPSLYMTAFVQHVLAPKEWGGLKNNGYECWAKLGATVIVGDDDGCTMVASSLHDTMGNMAIISPMWSAHHKIIGLVSSEDDWQDHPETIAPPLLEVGKRMQGFPSFQELLARLPTEA